MEASANEPDVPSESVLIEHYRVTMETFRHHADLYLKAFALYVALIGTTTGLAFTGDSADRRGAILGFLAAVSIFSVFSQVAVLRAGTVLDEQLQSLATALKVEPWPLAPIRALVTLVLVFSLAVAVAAAVLA